jgi:hypothetical protein
MLVERWRARWLNITNVDDLGDACVDLVDQVTSLHRETGHLPQHVSAAVFREVLTLLVQMPSTDLPKPRSPQQDPWGLAAAEFLFDVIEWCRMSGISKKDFANASPHEKNLAVRDYLMANPHASLRHVAAALRIPVTTVTRTPAWRALAERRRQINPPKPRGMSVQQIQHVLASKHEELDELIEDQSRDARSTRVYASQRV